MGDTLPWEGLGPHHRVLYELEGYSRPRAMLGRTFPEWYAYLACGLGLLYGGLEGRP